MVQDDPTPPDPPSPADAAPGLLAVLESAARLQQLVPDAVLVGGTAAALHARHRESHDHAHVVADLSDRFDVVLEALESEGEWVTNRVQPGKVILGRIDDYYTDQHGEGRGVAAQLVRQLADPRPKDVSVTRELAAYRNLDPRWTDWQAVRDACMAIAASMLDGQR